MSKKKERYFPKTFESTGKSGDTSANVYVSMLLSRKWKELTKNAQVLYLYCKAQYYAEKKKPTPKIKILTDDERRQCFTMNRSKWQDVYEIYASDNGQFYKDMSLLVEKGFIQVVESGKTTRTKSIYRFSDKWRQD